MPVLGTKSIGELQLGAVEIFLAADSSIGSASTTRLGVTRRLTSDSAAGSTADAYLGVTRRLRVVPCETTLGGIGSSQLGTSTVGDPTTGVAGADARLTVGVPREVSFDSAAGSTSNTGLRVLKRLSFQVSSGATATVTVWRGIFPDHLFVSLAEADAVSVALGDANGVSVSVGLRRRGQNPQP